MPQPLLLHLFRECGPVCIITSDEGEFMRYELPFNTIYHVYVVINDNATKTKYCDTNLLFGCGSSHVSYPLDLPTRSSQNTILRCTIQPLTDFSVSQHAVSSQSVSQSAVSQSVSQSVSCSQQSVCQSVSQSVGQSVSLSS